jgi:hypothetical protein
VVRDTSVGGELANDKKRREYTTRISGRIGSRGLAITLSMNAAKRILTTELAGGIDMMSSLTGGRDSGI